MYKAKLKHKWLYVKQKVKAFSWKVFWKVAPYVSLLVGVCIFLWLSQTTKNPSWINWYLSISANLASVFVIFLFYEIIKARSEREFKREVFEYAKGYVDGDIQSILHTLSKFFYGFQRGRLLTEQTKLLKLSAADLEAHIKDRKFIGFELFKSWDEAYKYFSKILENNFVLSRLNDDQILVILEMKNTIASIKLSFAQKDKFVHTQQKVTNYKIASGQQLNPQNIEYPNRFILLRDIGNDGNVVEDFGDFSSVDAEHLLDVYTIKREAIESIVVWSYTMFQLIRRWLELTGDHMYLNRR